jgi:hypothetical protein
MIAKDRTSRYVVMLLFTQIVANQPGMLRSAILFFCITLALLFSSSAFAQSGRRKEPAPVPAPTVPTQPPVSVSDASAKVTSLIVSGEIFHDDIYNRSNYLDGVLKELTIWMKYEPRPFRNVSKGGKMTLENAKERAKKETDATYFGSGS